MGTHLEGPLQRPYLRGTSTPSLLLPEGPASYPSLCQEVLGPV